MSDDLSTLELTSKEKLVKCVVLHNTGGLGSLSCMIPSLDHPPTGWLLQYSYICTYLYMYNVCTRMHTYTHAHIYINVHIRIYTHSL